MVDDLSDLYAELRRLRRDVDRLQTATPLQNASVGRGRTRFYDGSQLLIEDSNLDVTGTASVFGVLRVVGRAIIEGLGQLVVTSMIDLLGMMRVRGGGGIVVEDGGDIVVNGGEIKAGDVVIRDGKVYVGGMILDPSDHGGSIKFPNGAEVFTDGDTIQLVKGNSVVQVSDSYARLQNGGDVVQIDGDGIRMSPGAVSTVSGMGLPAGVMIHGAAGYVLKTDGS